MKHLIFLFIVFSITFNLHAQNSFCDQIVVEGKSSVKVEPGQYIFQVRLSASDSNYSRCADLALEKAEQMRQAFVKNGIDDQVIKTQNYSIREKRERNFQSNQLEFAGYEATIPLQVKTLFNYKKNDAIFEIIKNNFNSDFNLSFALTPEQTDEVKAKLIALAVEDAKRKAEIVAQSAGIKLGKISKIEYGEPRLIRNFNATSYNLQEEAIMLRGTSAAGTSVLNPSEIEMTTNILISWTIGD